VAAPKNLTRVRNNITFQLSVVPNGPLWGKTIFLDGDPKSGTVTVTADPQSALVFSYLDDPTSSPTAQCAFAAAGTWLLSEGHGMPWLLQAPIVDSRVLWQATDVSYTWFTCLVFAPPDYPNWYLGCDAQGNLAMNNNTTSIRSYKDAVNARCAWWLHDPTLIPP